MVFIDCMFDIGFVWDQFWISWIESIGSIEIKQQQQVALGCFWYGFLIIQGMGWVWCCRSNGNLEKNLLAVEFLRCLLGVTGSKYKALIKVARVA